MAMMEELPLKDIIQIIIDPGHIQIRTIISSHGIIRDSAQYQVRRAIIRMVHRSVKRSAVRVRWELEEYTLRICACG